MTVWPGMDLVNKVIAPQISLVAIFFNANYTIISSSYALLQGLNMIGGCIC